MGYIPGVVSRRGRELGIPTSFSDAVVEIDRQINAGGRKMDSRTSNGSRRWWECEADSRSS